MTRTSTSVVRSLRFRLTAWYVGILAVLLFGASLLLYAGIRSTLVGQTDAFLAAEARRLASVGAEQPGAAPDLDDLTEMVRSVSDLSAGHPAADTGIWRNVPELLLFDVTYLRYVSGPDHRTLAISPDLARQPALLASLDSLLPARDTPPTDGGFTYAGPDEERTMRVLTLPTHSGEAFAYVQAAVPWDHNADVLERLTLLLAVGLPVLLVPVGLGGWMLVGRTLRPIRRIVAEADLLDAPALSEIRFPLLPEATESDSEIGELVTTLNRMTTRLARSFSAQRRFAEAQQRFAADASHELRTPLTILQGEMELALTRPRDGDYYRAALGSALEEINRMGRIVEGLSFLARRDAGQMRQVLNGAEVDLTTLIRDAIEEVRPQADQKRITLHEAVTGSDSPLSVWGSSDQLLLLARNLLENAVKYTPPCGVVTITTEWLTEDRQDEVAALTVSDTGIGISPDDLPHVFERFWRADAVRSKPGTGLGLAICAQIAEAHGGSLSVHSEHGIGSTFRLTLPARQANYGLPTTPRVG